MASPWCVKRGYGRLARKADALADRLSNGSYHFCGVWACCELNRPAAWVSIHHAVVVPQLTLLMILSMLRTYKLRFPGRTDRIVEAIVHATGADPFCVRRACEAFSAYGMAVALASVLPAGLRPMETPCDSADQQLQCCIFCKEPLVFSHAPVRDVWFYHHENGSSPGDVWYLQCRRLGQDGKVHGCCKWGGHVVTYRLSDIVIEDIGRTMAYPPWAANPRALLAVC